MSETSKQRTARACEACRASKTRCIYKSLQGDCQRCEATGSRCLVRSKARPGRIRAAGPVNGSNGPKASDIFGNEGEFALDLPAVKLPDGGKDLQDLQRHHEGVFEQSEVVQCQDPGVVEPVEKRQVTLEQAEDLLVIFKRKATSFPFVHVPPEATVVSLAKTSPFVLLALLTSASMRDRPLYHQLDHEFRRILSSKVIVEGQKSLDFLQGILVYIAWYPHHVNPKNNQAFMYMSLAISLVGDLGLDSQSPVPHGFSSISTVGLYEGDGFSKAAKRAYLGCYYLSSSLTLGYQKPNSMQYRNLMDARGKGLLQDEACPEIYSIVKLQKILENISEADRAKQSQKVPLDSFYEEMKRQEFLGELQEWRISTPDSFRKIPVVCMAEKFAHLQIYSHELGFVRRPYGLERAMIGVSAPTTISNLWSCLEKSKALMEYILSVSEATFATFTVVQFACIVHAVLIMSRLTFLMASTLGWNGETTRSEIPLSMYLDCLAYRHQQITTTTVELNQAPKNPDAPYVMKMMLESVKKSYERRVAAIEPGFFETNDRNVVSPARGYCPVTDPGLQGIFNNAALSYQELYDMSTPSSSSAAPPFYDIWATMTGSWAEI